MREEPGQAHLHWMREFRNSTGLVSYPGIFYEWRIMPISTSAIQHVLNNWTIYVKPEQSRRGLRRILGDGLLTAEGEMHRRQRKVLNPAFATGYVRDAVPVFADKANELVDLISQDIKPEGVEVLHFLSRCTMDIMGAAGIPLENTNAGFGYEFRSLHNPNDPFARAYASMFERTGGARYLELAANYLPWLRYIPFPRMVKIAKARATIVSEATKLVRHKEAATTGKDILSLMILENRKSQDEKLAEMELVDQVMTFLLAGHETTSTAVCPPDSTDLVMLGLAYPCSASGNTG
jgi:cytochrome P450